MLYLHLGDSLGARGGLPQRREHDAISVRMKCLALVFGANIIKLALNGCTRLGLRLRDQRVRLRRGDDSSGPTAFLRQGREACLVDCVDGAVAGREHDRLVPLLP